MKVTRSVVGVFLLLTLPVAVRAAAPAPSLADLSLEELSEIEVTSVSRRPERLSEAAASIFVITPEAIRRSGATTLPEALRLAPNLQVARLDAGQYAISARGFNNAIGNKLLVLIDGRTVYAPFFSGVQWDQQDVMLDDVDRIEVISGPGATLWGANAVNGVINIVTRPAAQTQGALALLGGGNLETNAALRFGGKVGDGGYFRVYAKGSRLQNTETGIGIAVRDGWERSQVGFRADWTDADDSVTLQGDAFRGQSEDRGLFGPFKLGAVEVSEANLLMRWTRQMAGGSDLRIQAYHDHSKRDDALLYQPEEDITDLEFQHSLVLDTQHVVWGGGYRQARDNIRPGVFFGFVPPRRTLTWTNVFVQDEMALNEQLDAVVGIKLEHNDYTGMEVLPSARMAWKPSKERLLWAAVSRAVRAPARLDRDIVLPPAPPYIIAGGPDFDSEVALVYELGYRAQASRDLNFSLTAFHHDWDRLRSGQLPPNAHVQNMIEGSTDGVEAWAAWQPLQPWRLTAGVTTLHKNLRLKAGSTDPDGPKNLGNDADYQLMLRSAWSPSDAHDIDVTLRHVAALPNPAVPAYTAVDLRWGWRFSAGLEFSVLANNLFDSSHPEFNAAPGRSEIGRGVLVQLRWTP